eukprot:ANDGO_07539.mRNA.1 hypothetical protein
MSSAPSPYNMVLAVPFQTLNSQIALLWANPDATTVPYPKRWPSGWLSVPASAGAVDLIVQSPLLGALPNSTSQIAVQIPFVSGSITPAGANTPVPVTNGWALSFTASVALAAMTPSTSSALGSCSQATSTALSTLSNQPGVRVQAATLAIDLTSSVETASFTVNGAPASGAGYQQLAGALVTLLAQNCTFPVGAAGLFAAPEPNQLWTPSTAFVSVASNPLSGCLPCMLFNMNTVGNPTPANPLAGWNPSMLVASSELSAGVALRLFCDPNPLMHAIASSLVAQFNGMSQLTGPTQVSNNVISRAIPANSSQNMSGGSLSCTVTLSGSEVILSFSATVTQEVKLVFIHTGDVHYWFSSSVTVPMTVNSATENLSFGTPSAPSPVQSGNDSSVGDDIIEGLSSALLGGLDLQGFLTVEVLKNLSQTLQSALSSNLAVASTMSIVLPGSTGLFIRNPHMAPLSPAPLVEMMAFDCTYNNNFA